MRERENRHSGTEWAGKSLFVKSIAREFHPVQSEGLVFHVWGRDVWKVFELLPLLGIVSNDLQHAFAKDLMGKEVILSGFFSSIGLFHHHVTPMIEEKADKIMKFLEIDHLKERPMNALSSGEARRFLIGRTLVHDPMTLILDEPTKSLDRHALHTFRQTIRKIARAGTGIILIIHYLHDIIPEISRVILMKEGRFWKDGNNAGDTDR